jgi:hypothetical protein
MTAPRRVSSPQGQLPLQLPEGVHLRLPARMYEEAHAIGADDLRLLYWDPTSWWAQSEHNPHRHAPRRLARRYQRNTTDALRILVTQGDEAYAAAFTIEPDDARSDLARTRDEIRTLLRGKGVEIPKGDFSDRTMWGLVRKHGLSHRVFEVARADYEAARRAGRRNLSEHDDRRLRETARMIRAHGDLGPALTGGVFEATVLWRREEDPGALLCARFDYLRRRRIYDLQRVTTTGARDIDGAIRRTIEENDLEISRRLLPEAWERMADFLAEGQVYAWDESGERAAVLSADRDLLKSYVDAGAPEFVWIFVQLPVDEIGAEKGVVVAPRWHRPEGRIWEAGAEKIDAALEAYRAFRGRFALARQWAVIDDTKELVDADIRTRLKREMV